MPNQPSTIVPLDRRQRFRKFMRSFNPTASAKAAIGDGLICQFPGRSVFKKLAAGADLTLGSQQLLVGGIGSGKTTELMLAGQELARNKNTLPIYIDVSAETDLSTVNSGALLASLGMHIWRAISSTFSPPKELSDIHTAVRDAAYGHQKEVWVDHYAEHDYDPSDDADGHYETIRVAGKLKPPFPAFRRDVKDLAKTSVRTDSFFEGARDGTRGRV